MYIPTVPKDAKKIQPRPGAVETFYTFLPRMESLGQGLVLTYRVVPSSWLWNSRMSWSYSVRIQV